MKTLTRISIVIFSLLLLATNYSFVIEDREGNGAAGHVEMVGKIGK